MYYLGCKMFVSAGNGDYNTNLNALEDVDQPGLHLPGFNGTLAFSIIYRSPPPHPPDSNLYRIERLCEKKNKNCIPVPIKMADRGTWTTVTGDNF
jgi:hypothetical protein